MKILYKDGIKTICRDNHPNVEGWEILMLADDYPITKMVDGPLGQVEAVKSIEELLAEVAT
jgi:hypothetical protein